MCYSVFEMFWVFHFFPKKKFIIICPVLLCMLMMSLLTFYCSHNFSSNANSVLHYIRQNQYFGAATIWVAYELELIQHKFASCFAAFSIHYAIWKHHVSYAFWKKNCFANFVNRNLLYMQRFLASTTQNFCDLPEHLS